MLKTFSLMFSRSIHRQLFIHEQRGSGRASLAQQLPQKVEYFFVGRLLTLIKKSIQIKISVFLKFSCRGPCDTPAASTVQLKGTLVPFPEPLDPHLVVEVHGCSAKEY